MSTPRTDAMLYRCQQDDDCDGAVILCRELERELAAALPEALDEIVMLRDKLEKAHEKKSIFFSALKRYGSHMHSCEIKITSICTCGLHSALKGE